MSLTKDTKEVTLLEVSLDKGQYGSGASAIEYASNLPRYIRITDITEDGDLKKYGLKSPSTVEDKYLLEDEDFLFARSGSIGRTYLHKQTNKPCIYAGYLIRFKLNKNVILPKYLFYVTKSNYYWDWIKKQNKSVTISNINAQQYATFSFILPSLTVQKNIVRVLDAASEVIRLRKKLIENLNQLPQTLFIQMFGSISNEKKWKIEKWENTVNIINGKNQKDVISSNGKYPIYGSGGNLMGYSNEYLAPENSIIVGRKGTINRPVKIKTKFWNVDTAFALVPKKELNYDYLFIFCQLFNFEKLNTSTTLPSLTKNNLLQIEIMMPPIELQNKFAKILATVELTKEKELECLRKDEELFSSLMQQAFSGELFN